MRGLIILLIFWTASLSAQIRVKPNVGFAENVNPDSASFEVYSQKNGISEKANLYNLKKYYSPTIAVDVADDLENGDTIAVYMEFVRDSTLEVFYADRYGAVISLGGSGGFNSDRPILRVPQAGDNIGGSTITDWLNYWYFTEPTLSLALSPTTTIYEVGDTAYVTVSGSTSNPGSATLTAGALRITTTSDTLDAFGTGTSFTGAISFAPQKDSTADYKALTYSFQATQSWVSGGESGTASSSTKTITAVYPVLYGMSATDFTLGGSPYTGLTKLVEAEGNKSVTLTGSGYIYYAIPTNWGDSNLSVIYDHNGFNVTAAFDSYLITIASSGLVNNWSRQYRLYKLNMTTVTAGYEYTFNR